MNPPRITVILVAIGVLFVLSQWALSSRDDRSLSNYLATPTAAAR